MKLGGWWRLWIVTSVFWAVLVAAFPIAIFPTDTSATARVGSEYAITIDNLPITMSRADLTAKLERRFFEEREYAKLIERSMEEEVSKDEFDRATKSFSFKPKIGWSTGDAPPVGSVEIDSMPRERLARWAIKLFGLFASLPLVLLSIGLSVRWVKDGFRANRSVTK